MKLTRIEVKNYRSLFTGGETAFGIDLAEGMNAIAGPNNTGKSNLLRAVALALDPDAEFDREVDLPGPMMWAIPRITLEFTCDERRQIEKTLLRYAREYELTVSGAGPGTFADDGIIRFTVSYPGNDRSGATRQEWIAARAAGARQGEQAKLDKALAQLHKCVRFVMVSSGESLESLLAGKFREILQTVIQETRRPAFEQAERRRAGYVEGLQRDLLAPLTERIGGLLGELFPEITKVELVPWVGSIDETLSEVEIWLSDTVETALSAKGTGVRGGVLVAMLRYLADQSRRSMIFAIEEPEAFLHPAAQEDLRDDLEALAERDDVTVLITTHSPFIVSRAPEAQLVSVQKDAQGRTRVVGCARGSESYASVLAGLFRDASLSDMIDRAARLPAGAQGVLFVEGTTDEQYLRLAAERAGRSDLLDGLHIVPSGGASRVIVDAILMKAQTPLPVLALLDNDLNGRDAASKLTGLFGLSKKREVLSYADLFKGKPENVEAEDLWPNKLLQRFVDEQGEDMVQSEKVWLKALGAWHYGFNGTGKDLIGDFLRAYARAADAPRWIELLVLIRQRLGLPTVATQPAAPASLARPVAGADDFEASIAHSDEAHRPMLSQLLAWARTLEVEGLARLFTTNGKGRWALTPRVVDDTASLATIWNENGPSVCVYRSVFERTGALASLARLEQLVAPASVGKGTSVGPITDELLETLTAAYREASAGPETPS